MKIQVLVVLAVSVLISGCYKTTDEKPRYRSSETLNKNEFSASSAIVADTFKMGFSPSLTASTPHGLVLQACSELQLSGTVDIRSESGLPGLEHKAAIAASVAASNVVINGRVRVDGSIFSDNLTRRGKSSIVGATASPAPGCVMPILADVRLQVASQKGALIGEWLHVTGNLVLQGGAYYFKAITLDAGASLTFGGPAVVFADATIVDGTFGNFPSTLSLFTHSLKITGEGRVAARLVADSLKVAGNSVLLGTALTEQAIISGTAKLVYPDVLREFKYYSLGSPVPSEPDFTSVYLTPISGYESNITEAGESIGLVGIEPFVLEGKTYFTGSVINPGVYEQILQGVAGVSYVGNPLIGGSGYSSLQLNPELYIWFKDVMDDFQIQAFIDRHASLGITLAHKDDPTAVFISTPSKTTIELLRIANELQSDPAVFASAPRILPIGFLDSTRVVVPRTLSDDQFPNQWGLDNIKAPEAWPFIYGGEVLKDGVSRRVITSRANATIGIFDSGVDITHTDLNGVSSLREPGDDSHYTNTAGYHGTGVASIALAEQSDGGTVGVMWGAAGSTNLVSRRIFDCEGCAMHSLAPTWLKEMALEYNAVAINASFHLGNPTNEFSQAVLKANYCGRGGTYNGCTVTASCVASGVGLGTVFVGAAGNTMSSFEGATIQPVNYPANLNKAMIGGVECYAKRTLAVSAICQDGFLARDLLVSQNPILYFSSNRGAEVSITAPGCLIPMAGTSNTIILESGTSMAAPHVSGAIGALANIFPSHTAKELGELVLISARTTGNGESDAYGAGALDLEAALYTGIMAKEPVFGIAPGLAPALPVADLAVTSIAGQSASTSVAISNNGDGALYYAIDLVQLNNASLLEGKVTVGSLDLGTKFVGVIPAHGGRTLTMDFTVLQSVLAFDADFELRIRTNEGMNTIDLLSTLWPITDRVDFKTFGSSYIVPVRVVGANIIAIVEPIVDLGCIVACKTPVCILQGSKGGCLIWSPPPGWIFCPLCCFACVALGDPPYLPTHSDACVTCMDSLQSNPDGLDTPICRTCAIEMTQSPFADQGVCKDCAGEIAETGGAALESVACMQCGQLTKAQYAPGVTDITSSGSEGSQ